MEACHLEATHLNMDSNLPSHTRKFPNSGALIQSPSSIRLYDEDSDEKDHSICRNTLLVLTGISSKAALYQARSFLKEP